MSWDVRPTQFSATIRKDLAEKHNEIVLFMHRSVVLKSPVKDGRFRGNHIISVNRKVRGVRATLSKTPQPALSKGYRELASSRDIAFKVVHIQNNLPYAKKLEHGSSDQARAGVYGVTYESAKARYAF